MKLFYYEEAIKCFNYAISIYPEASDAYLRRSQAIMYDRDSTMTEFKIAIDDINKALKKRPKDKFYN